MDDSLVRSRICSEMKMELGLKTQTSSQSSCFTEAFLSNSVQDPLRHDVRNMLSHKAVILGRTKSKGEKKKKNKRAKGLNAQDRKKMKIYQIKDENQRYELFLPLHQLWKQYIINLCGGLKANSNPQSVQQKLVKADFHGAVISVVRSKCPSYVGTEGILIQEFKHVFKIITKENKVKVIPKRNSVFSVEINGFVSNIYGNKFEQRASERSAKKFKVRGTIDL